MVPVMHLIAFRRLEAGPLNHDDGASWWFWETFKNNVSFRRVA
jgi:hypothetical protein